MDMWPNPRRTIHIFAIWIAIALGVLYNAIFYNVSMFYPWVIRAVGVGGVPIAAGVYCVRMLVVGVFSGVRSAASAGIHRDYVIF